MKHLRDTYGRTVRVRHSLFGEAWSVLSSDASDCKLMFIFGSDVTKPIRQAIRAREKYFKSREIAVLSTAQGDSWRKLRTSMQKYLLNSKYLDQYSDKIEDVALEFVKKIKEIRHRETHELPEDFYKTIQKWSLETLGRVCLGHKFGCLETNISAESYKLHIAHLHLFEQMNALENTKMWHYWPTAISKDFYKSMDYIMEVVENLIEAKANMEKGDAVCSKPENGRNIADFLLQQQYDIKTATAFIVDLLSGGVETVANTVGSVLYALATHPECQKKLREELKHGKPEENKQTTTKQPGDISYLKACVMESMRLFPIVPANTRTLTKDVMISDYNIPKGTMVVACHGLMGLDEKYFYTPNEYIPERHIRSSDKYCEINKFAMMPFGHGSRTCVAKRLADQMIETVIARVVQHYDLKWTGGPLEMKYQLHRQIKTPLKFILNDNV